MKWLDQSHSNVNANISLAQFSFSVILKDSYISDYSDIAYPGLIMKVGMSYLQVRILSCSVTSNKADWLSCSPDLYTICCVCGEYVLYKIIGIIIIVIVKILAWLSLFISAESVPGRVGMGMTTLLTLTAMFSSVGIFS